MGRVGGWVQKAFTALGCSASLSWFFIRLVCFLFFFFPMPPYLSSFQLSAILLLSRGRRGILDSLSDCLIPSFPRPVPLLSPLVSID